MALLRRERNLAAALDVGGPSIEAEELLLFPLSAEQQRMWQAERDQPGTSVYNAAYRWDLRGPTDCLILERTFNEIVRRHESLRSRFLVIGKSPNQVVDSALYL